MKPEEPNRPPEPSLEHDATIVSWVVELVHARRKGDYLTAADAHRELERLGVLIRFPRKGKAVPR